VSRVQPINIKRDSIRTRRSAAVCNKDCNVSLAKENNETFALKWPTEVFYGNSFGPMNSECGLSKSFALCCGNVAFVRCLG